MRVQWLPTLCATLLCGHSLSKRAYAQRAARVRSDIVDNGNAGPGAFKFDAKEVEAAAREAVPSFESEVTPVNFPYHAASIHGVNFAEGALKHVQSVQGTDEEMAIAYFWGLYHDFGYVRAAEAQNYSGGVLADIFAWDQDTSKSLTKQLGANHEMYSIQGARKAIGNMTGPLAAVLQKPEAMFLGRYMVSKTKMGPPQLAHSAFWMSALSACSDCEKELVVPSAKVNVRHDEGHEGFAAKVKDIMMLGGKCDAECFGQAGENGDFYYMYQNHAVCKNMNVFAEFYVYGGVPTNVMEKNQTIVDTCTSFPDQLAAFWNGQNFFYQMIDGRFPFMAQKVVSQPSDGAAVNQQNIRDCVLIGLEATDERPSVADFKQLHKKLKNTFGKRCTFKDGVGYTAL